VKKKKLQLHTIHRDKNRRRRALKVSLFNQLRLNVLNDEYR